MEEEEGEEEELKFGREEVEVEESDLSADGRSRAEKSFNGTFDAELEEVTAGLLLDEEVKEFEGEGDLDGWMGRKEGA